MSYCAIPESKTVLITNNRDFSRIQVGSAIRELIRRLLKVKKQLS